MATRSEPVRVPVLIAGGGPVGLVTALELGRRGIRCLLLNDQPTTAQHPKANAIASRSMEHFRRLGVASAIRQRGLPPDHCTDVAYFTRLDRYELARYPMPSREEALRRVRAGEGPWASPEPPHRCSQIFLEDSLYQHALTFPSIELRYGWRLDAFTDEGDQVVATAIDVASGERCEIVADYLVGADGGASRVRRVLGIEFAGASGIIRPFMGGSMLGLYFRAKVDIEKLGAKRAWQYWIVAHDFRSLLVHVDADEHFLLLANIPEGQTLDQMDFPELCRRTFGVPVDIEVISSVAWTAGYSLVTQRYGRGRVFMAGDAVHLFTPTGGMGMNTGVDDAVNLGWKLAALCRGWGGGHLLHTYESERRPIGLRNTDHAAGFATSVGTVAASAQIDRPTPAGEAERAALGERLRDHAFHEFIIPGIQLGLRYEGSPIVAYDDSTPPEDVPNSYTPSASPGCRAPHLWLADGSALFDRLGMDFTLLRLGGSAADVSPLVDAAKARGVPLDVVDIDDAAVRETYERTMVLIRPDQHVAWRGDTLPGDCLALIDRVRGA